MVHSWTDVELSQVTLGKSLNLLESLVPYL